MKQTIWKFDIDVDDEQQIKMPQLAELLSVQPQKGSVCIWALVNPDNPIVDRNIIMSGTGHDLSDRLLGKFLGTFQITNGDLVFHVFDGGEV